MKMECPTGAHILHEPRTVKQAWLIELVKRVGVKRACIALANKTVRTAWALLATGESYKPILISK